MITIRQFIFVALFLQFLIPNQESFSQDWPQWRGANRDGMISTSEIPEVWPEKLQRIWQIEVGTGHSSPVITKNTIYLFSRQGDEEVASRINMENGKVIWRKSYPVPYTMNSAARAHGKGPKSTSAVFAGKLITLGISDILSCFETETGQMIWQKDFSKEFKTTSPLYGTAMSPLIEDGVCIAHVGGHDDGALLAVNIQSGKIQWQWTDDGPGYSSPILVTIAGTKQVVTFSQEHISGINFVSGDF